MITNWFYIIFCYSSFGFWESLNGFCLLCFGRHSKDLRGRKFKRLFLLGTFCTQRNSFVSIFGAFIALKVTFRLNFLDLNWISFYKGAFVGIKAEFSLLWCFLCLKMNLWKKQNLKNAACASTRRLQVDNSPFGRQITVFIAWIFSYGRSKTWITHKILRLDILKSIIPLLGANLLLFHRQRLFAVNKIADFLLFCRNSCMKPSKLH